MFGSPGLTGDEHVHREKSRMNEWTRMEASLDAEWKVRDERVEGRWMISGCVSSTWDGGWTVMARGWCVCEWTGGRMDGWMDR